MINNAHTSTNKQNFSSLIEFNEVYKVQPLASDIDHFMSIFDAGYLFSIELKRQKIKSDLEINFEFKESTKEIDFLSLNQDVYELLPSIGDYLKKKFPKAKLCLELMEENNNWQTLFINLSTNEKFDWDEINYFIDTFFDNMFELFPKIAKKINIDLIQDEF